MLTSQNDLEPEFVGLHFKHALIQCLLALSERLIVKPLDVFYLYRERDDASKNLQEEIENTQEISVVEMGYSIPVAQ